MAKYSQVRTLNGITGAEVARQLLDSQGLNKVAIHSSYEEWAESAGGDPTPILVVDNTS